MIVRGSGTFGVGDQQLRVTEGDLVVFPAGQDHVLLESSPDFYLYAVGLEPRFSTEVLGADPLLPVHLTLRRAELQALVTRAASLVDRRDTEQLGAELWEHVHWLSRQAPARGAKGAHVLTRRTLQALSAAPELDLGAIAKTLRAHPAEVSRHFHRDLGLTLVSYRTRRRLLCLIELVSRESEPLTSAASKAGFGSYSQCHRAFRAQLGCGPNQFFTAGVREQMQLAYLG